MISAVYSLLPMVQAYIMKQFSIGVRGSDTGLACVFLRCCCI